MAKPRLTKEERKALVQVRDALANGMLEHRRNFDALPGAERGFFSFSLRRLFNMGCPARETQCGTVACIGGWMGAFMGKSPSEAYEFVDIHEEGKFGELFYPFSVTDDQRREKSNYEAITPKQAIKAIDNFLKTGKPNWQRALAR